MEPFQLCGGHGVRIGRQSSLGDELGPFRGGVADLRADLGERIGKAWRVVGEAEQIVGDENLAMRSGAGTDADHGNANLLNDGSSHGIGHGFEQEDDCAGIFEPTSIGEQGQTLLSRTPDRSIPAMQADILGAKSDMSADRNARAGELLDEGSERAVEFELDHIGEAFGHETTGVADGLCFVGLIGEEGHVGHDEGIEGSSAQRGGDGNRVFERHVDGAVVAECDLCGRVTSEKDMHAGAIEPASHAGVIGCQTGEGRTPARHLFERAQSDTARAWFDARAHRQVYGGVGGGSDGVGCGLMERARQQAEAWGPEAARVSVGQIDRWLRRVPLGTTVTLLDTGIGSAEACMRLLRAARERGHALRVVSVQDSNVAGEPYSTERVEAFEVVRLDPFSIVEHFGAGSFDFVLTQLRMSPLREVPRLTWLRLVDRVAERGVVWVERAGLGGLDRRLAEELVDRVGMRYLRHRHQLFSPWMVFRGLKREVATA